MCAVANNKYSIAARVAMLENAATELRKELAAIQLIPGKDGRDGRNGADAVCICKNGRDGAEGRPGQAIVGPKGDKGDSIIGPQGIPGQSIVGPQGPAGPQGSVLYVGPEEVAAAVAECRAELVKQRARFTAAWLTALARNSERRHPGIKSAVDSVLEKLKSDAGL